MVKRVRSEDVSDFVGYWLCEDGRIVERDTGMVVTVYGNGTVRLLKSNGRKSNVVAHRLIAEAFVARPKGANFVKFKDGNSNNRAANNLQWVLGVKPISDRSKEIVGLKLEGLTTTQISELMHCTPQYVNRVLRDHKKRLALGNPDQA